MSKAIQWTADAYFHGFSHTKTHSQGIEKEEVHAYQCVMQDKKNNGWQGSLQGKERNDKLISAYLSSVIFSLADKALFGQQKHAAASFSWPLAIAWHSCSPRPLR